MIGPEISRRIVEWLMGLGEHEEDRNKREKVIVEALKRIAAGGTNVVAPDDVTTNIPLPGDGFPLVSSHGKPGRGTAPDLVSSHGIKAIPEPQNNNVIVFRGKRYYVEPGNYDSDVAESVGAGTFNVPRRQWDDPGSPEEIIKGALHELSIGSAAVRPGSRYYDPKAVSDYADSQAKAALLLEALGKERAEKERLLSEAEKIRAEKEIIGHPELTPEGLLAASRSSGRGSLFSGIDFSAPVPQAPGQARPPGTAGVDIVFSGTDKETGKVYHGLSDGTIVWSDGSLVDPDTARKIKIAVAVARRGRNAAS